MPVLYRKTAKGQAEIETRAHRLAPRLRTALILVDGRRSDDALRELIGAQAEPTLAALATDGFIETVETRSPAAVPRAAAAAAPAPEPRPRAPALPFETRRRDAVRELTDLVGPMAEALALKMEKARDAAELEPLLEVARQVVANTRGAAAAAQYAARFAPG